MWMGDYLWWFAHRPHFHKLNEDDTGVSILILMFSIIANGKKVWIKFWFWLKVLIKLKFWFWYWYSLAFEFVLIETANCYNLKSTLKKRFLLILLVGCYYCIGVKPVQEDKFVEISTPTTFLSHYFPQGI